MKKHILWLLTLAWAALIWRLTTTPQIMVTEEFWLQNILMMGAHFSFFGAQAVLIKYSLSIALGKHASIAAVLGASIYGLLIEYVQLTVPGRSADPMDWLLDTLGAIAFLLTANKIKTILKSE